MRRVAFLTLADPTRFVIDESVGIAALAEQGISVDEIPWNAATDWTAYDGVLIRTTWDYHEQPTSFLAAIRVIAANCRLGNSAELVAWNLDKRYLQELEARGVPVVPSEWAYGGDFNAVGREFESKEVIVKPTVSANAMDTIRLPNPVGPEQTQMLVQTFAARHWFAQPFVESILTEGEYSVYFFGGTLSHAIRKIPKGGDFRVQETHGGQIESCPISVELKKAADSVMAGLNETPVQARVDLVRLASGELALIELELIEPALYLHTNENAATIFADAVARWLVQADN